MGLGVRCAEGSWICAGEEECGESCNNTNTALKGSFITSITDREASHRCHGGNLGSPQARHRQGIWAGLMLTFDIIDNLSSYRMRQRDKSLRGLFFRSNRYDVERKGEAIELAETLQHFRWQA